MRFIQFDVNKLFHIFFVWFVLLPGCNSNPKQPASNTIEKTSNSTKNITDVTVYATGNTMTEMAFEPNVITVNKGGFIKLKLINKGTDKMMVHNIVFTKKGTADEIGVKAIRAGEAKEYIPDDPAVIAASKLIGPSDSTVLQFKTPEVGSYPFICTYPGHYLKMRGRLVVEP